MVDITASGRIDWVTATTLSSDKGMDWLRMFNAMTDTPSQVRPAGTHGFKGVSIPGLRWLYRETDRRYMMVASSDMAAELWPRIVMSGVKVTRVDMAVDVLLDKPLPGLIHRWYNVLSRVDNKWGTSAILNSSMGQTLYSGSRQSDLYGRVYDKGAQSGDSVPGSWYRYEIELKAKRARQASTMLVENRFTPHVARQEAVKTVHDFFHNRYVPVPFTPETFENSAWLTAYVRQSSTDKKIAWLSTQVRPTVEYLFEVGLGDAALEALGLSGKNSTKYAPRLDIQGLLKKRLDKT